MATKKPMYQPWNEEAFVADERVLAMNTVQRWMYRTLLQKAFFGSERPNLPANEGRLWMLAGCSSRAEWDANKELVLECFVHGEVDGVPILWQKRLVADWKRLEEKREAMALLGQRGGQTKADNRQADAYRTSSDDLAYANRTSTKRREGKRSEGKRSEESEGNERDTARPQEMLVTTQHESLVTTPQGSASNAPQDGEPGYYSEGQYGFLNTAKKAADRMGMIWKNIVGKSAMARRPFGNGWNWFEEIYETSDIDVLIPAFEIWATERGKFNAERVDSPIMEFLKDDPGGWMKRVLPLNTFDGGKYIEPVISEELAAEQLAAHKKQWGLTLPQLEDELQNEEAAIAMLGSGFTPEERERTEKKIESLKLQIEQERAYLAGRN